MIPKSRLPEYAPSWISALRRHLEAFTRYQFRIPLKTLYLGGGTPSLLERADFEALANIRDACFQSTGVDEWTLEVNPEDVSLEKVKMWRDYGFNRVSLGVQSFDSHQLRRLERLSTSKAIPSAIEIISREFKNFNIDLMIGIPDQTTATLKKDFETLVRIKPPHASVYILTLADNHRLKNSAFMKSRMADDDLVIEFYGEVCEQLRDAGYSHYEISNFAQPGFQAAHNANYWNTSSSYLALGPGAHGYLKTSEGRARYENFRDPGTWSTSPHGISSLEYLTAEQQKLESFYLRLRTRQPVYVSEIHQKRAEEFLRMGWIEMDHDAIRLTERGWILMESIVDGLLPRFQDEKHTIQG